MWYYEVCGKMTILYNISLHSLCSNSKRVQVTFCTWSERIIQNMSDIIWDYCGYSKAIHTIALFSRPVMTVSNLDTIEFIFNFIDSECIFYFIYSIELIAWLFLGYGIIQVVQKMLLLKRSWPNKNFITLFTSNSKLRLNLTQRVI